MQEFLHFNNVPCTDVKEKKKTPIDKWFQINVKTSGKVMRSEVQFSPFYIPSEVDSKQCSNGK